MACEVANKNLKSILPNHAIKRLDECVGEILTIADVRMQQKVSADKRNIFLSNCRISLPNKFHRKALEMLDSTNFEITEISEIDENDCNRKFRIKNKITEKIWNIIYFECKSCDNVLKCRICVTCYHQNSYCDCMNSILGYLCSHSHLINLLIKGKGYVAIDGNRKRTLKLQPDPLFQDEVLEPLNVNSSILNKIDENYNISVENLEIVPEIDLNIEINAKVEQLISKLRRIDVKNCSDKKDLLSKISDIETMVNCLPFISLKRKAARQTKEDMETQREKRTRIFNKKKRNSNTSLVTEPKEVTREEQYTCKICFERKLPYDALNILNISETIEWIECTNCFIWHHKKCLSLGIKICTICRNIIS